MAYIWIAGVLGFFVFDCYRIHATYQKSGIVFLTFSSFHGMIIHILAYVAAGILAVFINLDTFSRCCEWAWFPSMNENMTGPLLRGFGLGLAGPAGLSKSGGLATQKANRGRVGLDDLSLRELGVWDQSLRYMRVLLMR